MATHTNTSEGNEMNETIHLDYFYDRAAWAFYVPGLFNVILTLGDESQWFESREEALSVAKRLGLTFQPDQRSLDFTLINSGLNDGQELTRAQALAYLERDDNLDVPCSRYGKDTRECAEVAYRAALVFQDANGDAITTDLLDSLMSDIVNDSDGIAEILSEFGDEQ